MEKLKGSNDNREARMNFVTYWAKYIRSNPDSVWGEQHKSFINSLMQIAKHYPFSPRQYLEMRGEKVGKGR